MWKSLFLIFFIINIIIEEEFWYQASDSVIGIMDYIMYIHNINK